MPTDPNTLTEADNDCDGFVRVPCPKGCDGTPKLPPCITCHNEGWTAEGRRGIDEDCDTDCGDDD